MTNMFMCVGRLTINPKLIDNKTDLTIAVNRSYKNEDGIYETDFISFTLNNDMAKQVCDYCRKGDLIGLKGSLEVEDNKICLKVDKISFLTTKQSE